MEQPNPKKPSKFSSATPPVAGEPTVLELSALDVPGEGIAQDVRLAGLVVHAAGKGPAVLHYQFTSGDHATKVQSAPLEPSRIQNITGESLALEGPTEALRLKIWAEFPGGEVVGVTCPRVMVTFPGPGEEEASPESVLAAELPVPVVRVDQQQKSPVEIDTGAIRVQWSCPWDDEENPLEFEVIRRVGVDGVWLRNGKTSKRMQRDPVFEQVPISYRVRSALAGRVSEWSEEATMEGHLIQHPWSEQ